MHRDSVFVWGLILVLGCQVNTENSVSGDRNRYGQNSNPSNQATSVDFNVAQQIIQRRCASCHFDFAKYSERQWVESHYVVPGEVSKSLLFTRLKGAGMGGKENMPPDNPLERNEIASIEFWIKNLKGTR